MHRYALQGRRRVRFATLADSTFVRQLLRALGWLSQSMIVLDAPGS